MKAAVVHGKEDIRYEEIQRPQPLEGQVLIKVKYTGICGSDIPRVNGDACHFYPNVLGHEFSGTVSKIGSGVSTLKVGDRVAGVPLVPCLKCEDCQKGNYSLCKHYSFIGSREFGSFAEYVVVPEKNAVKFEDGVSFEQGAFFEPATVALHGLQRVNYQGGKTVAILGGGTIGLFVMQWAKIFGAKKVVVFDIAKERLELAKRLGADAVVNTLEADFMEQAKEEIEACGYDYVYETAGNTITMKMAFELAGNKAQVCFVGTPTKELSFTVEEWEQMNRKEFTLTGSWMSYSAPFPGKEWELTAHYFKTGELKFDESFIFKKMPLKDIADAFEMYKVPGAVKGKILINSQEEGTMKVDPSLVPQRKLYTGDFMPGIGMGTFGSDKYSKEEVSEAVYGAIEVGYRMFDCASCYGNEDEIGKVFERAFNNNLVTRQELFITSKVWNNQHDEVEKACRKSLKDLKLEYLDLYFIHWPFPNYHAPGCSVESRNPNSKPFSVDQFMKTWRQCEQLVELGLVKHIGMSNMTVHKLEQVLPLCKIQPAAIEFECHPAFQQEELFQYLKEHNIEPIGFCPIGSPSRPERDKTPEDVNDMEIPEVVTIAKKHKVHPAIICLKWAVQRGVTPIPFSVKPTSYISNLLCTTMDPLTNEEMLALSKVDANCRLIKGQVFLWESAKGWEDLWD